ncbi:MAG: ABC transporter ATP-binding protein [Bacteroidia bacterium]|nr:ABC transporter ATP-binding protein [Bacteroidia bacterium]
MKNVSCVFTTSPSFIIGANGSGKTSLMQSIAGLIKYSGEISIDNKNTLNFTKKELAQMIAFVPQLFPVLPKISVFDYVMLARFPNLAWLGQFTSRDKEIAQEYFSKLKIEHLADRLLSETSGGELKKIVIARALVQGSPVIIMDEPLQGLDPFQRKELMVMIESLREEGKMLCIVSHDREFLERFNSDTLAIKNNSIWYFGQFDGLPKNWIKEIYSK